jgi:hypothetical protein
MHEHISGLCSGMGAFHTNEPDPDKPWKQLAPYLTIDWREILAMADNPHNVDKEDGQWLIPSNYLGRKFAEQEKSGEFLLLWADVDKNPVGIEKLLTIVEGFIGDADVEVYSSKGATEGNQKARVLIPLAKPLTFSGWRMCQDILGDKLASAGIEPDRAVEGAGQLCYLPNRGAFYRNLSRRRGIAFDPVAAWSNEIKAKRAEIAKQQDEAKKAREIAKERRDSIALGQYEKPAQAFNAVYTPQEIMLSEGYAQKGNRFRHPNSESGSYSASVKLDDAGEWRVHSLSSSDPLYTGGGGGGAHSAFSVFATLLHGGKHKAAAEDAGKHYLTINGKPWHDVSRREYAKRKAKEQAEAVDIDWETLKRGEDSDAGGDSDSLDTKSLVYDFPEFADSDMYGIAGEFARLATKDSEAAPVAVYASFLVAMSALIGEQRYSMIGDSRHHPKFFVAIVGESAKARKGTSYDPVQIILRKVEEM